MLSIIPQPTLEERAQLLLPRLLALANKRPLASPVSLTLTPEEESSLSVDELRTRLTALSARRFELRRSVHERSKSEGEPETNVVPLESILKERARAELKALELDWRRRRARGDATARDMNLSEHVVFSDRNVEERISKAVSEHSLKRSKLEKLGGITAAFRLAGTSCFSVAGLPRFVGVRFDPAAFGRYAKERAYVILDAKLKVFRHNLPAFVPVADLEIAFLPIDPAGFLKRVGRYCASWQARAVEAQRIADDYRRDGRGEVKWTHSRDVVTLRGRFEIDVDKILGRTEEDEEEITQTTKRRVATCVTLRFGHLLDALPDEVSVEVEGERPGEPPLVVTSAINRVDYETRGDFRFGVLIEQALGRIQ